MFERNGAGRKAFRQHMIVLLALRAAPIAQGVKLTCDFGSESARVLHVAAQKHVARLEVAVHDVVLVQMRHGPSDVDGCRNEWHRLHGSTCRPAPFTKERHNLAHLTHEPPTEMTHSTSPICDQQNASPMC